MLNFNIMNLELIMFIMELRLATHLANLFANSVHSEYVLLSNIKSSRQVLIGLLRQRQTAHAKHVI